MITNKSKPVFELCGLLMSETLLKETVYHSKDTRRHNACALSGFR